MIPEVGESPKSWPEPPTPPELLPLPAGSWLPPAMTIFPETCSHCRGSRLWTCHGCSRWRVAAWTWAASTPHTHTQVGSGARWGGLRVVQGRGGGDTQPAGQPLV